MVDLTAHLLVESDAGVEETLESLEPLNCHVLLGAVGEKGLAACRKWPYRAVVAQTGDRAKARNGVVAHAKTEWHLWLDPGEALSAGHGLVPDLLTGPPKRVYVVHDDLITKEVRLFPRGRKFSGRVYESVQPDDDAEAANVFLAGASQPSRLAELVRWKAEAPHAPEVDYYLACQYLALGDPIRFADHARQFLFKETQPTCPAVMTRYYLALVALRRRDFREAAGHLLVCLAQQPLMAEFWCLLGDCFFKGGYVDRAFRLYRNALGMGKERATDDPYPMVPSKYGEYPDRMIELCKEVSRTVLSART